MGLFESKFSSIATYDRKYCIQLIIEETVSPGVSGDVRRRQQMVSVLSHYSSKGNVETMLEIDSLFEDSENANLDAFLQDPGQIFSGPGQLALAGSTIGAGCVGKICGGTFAAVFGTSTPAPVYSAQPFFYIQFIHLIHPFDLFI